MSSPPRQPGDSGGYRSRSSDLLRINHIASELLRQESTEDLLWTLAERLGSALDLEDCVIYMRAGENLIQTAAFGKKSPAPRQIANPITIALGNGITGLVARSGTSMLIRDTADDPLYVADLVAGRSELAVPLVHQGVVLGVIDSESTEVARFSEADRGFMQQVADLASPRIAAARAEESRRNDLKQRVRELEEALRRARKG